MAKKPPITPLPMQPEEKSLLPRGTRLQKKSTLPNLWLWLCGLLLLGVIILGIVSYYAWGWVQTVQAPLAAKATPVPITTFKVGRMAPYAGLNFTVVNAQYAPYFADDDIRSGVAVVRLNMYIENTTTDSIQVIYYDIARLLAPELDPIPPTNVHLSVGPKLGASENGWIDFAVSKDTPLATLTLQLGSTALGESLVTIPFSGAFDPSIYASKVLPQSVSFDYDDNGTVLTYHVTSIEVDLSYKGSQCKEGQRIYVVNFRVDNNNEGDVSPGFGFDYVRLVINGYARPPFDNTLPSTFKAGAKGVAGRVAFSGPIGLNTLTLGFLSQNGNPAQDHDITL